MAKTLGPTFSFQGLPVFKDLHERATDEVRAKVYALMEQTALDVRDTARAHVDVDDGDLRDNIITEGKGKFWRVGISDAVISRRGGDRIHQRPFIYGWIQEYGNKDQPADPFMRPAADTHLARFQSRLPDITKVI
jgi:hypothetical protein